MLYLKSHNEKGLVEMPASFEAELGFECRLITCPLDGSGKRINVLYDRIARRKGLANLSIQAGHKSR